MGRPPEYWTNRKNVSAWLLAPIGMIYGAVAGARMNRPGQNATLPVICVGNFTVGGAGKTPVAMAVAEACLRIGYKPAFLSRGYGGSEKGPLIVEPKSHKASQVGDEPLLLARRAKTVVSADRLAGARLIAEFGSDIIIMDDGFQNASINKDLSLIVVDGGAGIGNGWPMPAGPLRASLTNQLQAADAVIRLGRGEPGLAVVRKAARAAVPVFAANYEPVRKRGYKTKHYLAFAGIARPSKFYETLENSGVHLDETIDFDDHHLYSEDDCRRILNICREKELVPMTTEKDWVRLDPTQEAASELLAVVEQFPVVVRFDEARRLENLITEMLSRRRGRRGLELAEAG